MKVTMNRFCKPNVCLHHLKLDNWARKLIILIENFLILNIDYNPICEQYACIHIFSPIFGIFGWYILMYKWRFYWGPEPFIQYIRMDHTSFWVQYLQHLSLNIVKGILKLNAIKMWMGLPMAPYIYFFKIVQVILQSRSI